jgi:hypothetical protein
VAPLQVGDWNIRPDVRRRLDNTLEQEGFGDSPVADARAFFRGLPLRTRPLVGNPRRAECPRRRASVDARDCLLGLRASGEGIFAGGQETGLPGGAVQICRPCPFAKAPANALMAVFPRAGVWVGVVVHLRP